MFLFKITRDSKGSKIQIELTLHRSEHKYFIGQIMLYLYTEINENRKRYYIRDFPNHYVRDDLCIPKPSRT